jgi:hypothetical protein
MTNQDLIDFFLENDRWKKIGPLNQIKSYIFRATKYCTDFSPYSMSIVRDKFRGIGKCEVIEVSESERLENLNQYYLLWCWPGSKKQIRFDEYTMGFRNKNMDLPEYDNIHKKSQSLRDGWSDEIEIIVAFDTTRNNGLIVDGTHRALALYYIRQEAHKLLEELFKKSGLVKICVMSSPQCSIIFNNDL